MQLSVLHRCFRTVVQSDEGVSRIQLLLVYVCRLSFLSFILPYSAILVRINVVISSMSKARYLKFGIKIKHQN